MRAMTDRMQMKRALSVFEDTFNNERIKAIQARKTMFIVKLHKTEFGAYMYLGDEYEVVPKEAKAARFHTRDEAEATASAYQKRVASAWRDVPTAQVLEVRK